MKVFINVIISFMLFKEKILYFNKNLMDKNFTFCRVGKPCKGKTLKIKKVEIMIFMINSLYQ